MEVVRDSQDANQTAFQVAAAAIVTDREAGERDQWDRVFVAGALVGTVLAFPAACLGTIIGCYGGTLVIMAELGG
jgi:hypothetical protein